MTEPEPSTANLLNALLIEAGLARLTAEEAAKFADYLDLILKWNARMNLTSVRDRDGILRRHFVECIACARALPTGIASVLDLGSGAGFPGIPIAICRPELSVTLAESQSKKAAFLMETVRVLGLSAKVFAGRAESCAEKFDCVALRAVDRMTAAVEAAKSLLAVPGWLVAMTTDGNQQEIRNGAGVSFRWEEPIRLPGSEQRTILIGCKSEG